MMLSRLTPIILISGLLSLTACVSTQERDSFFKELKELNSPRNRAFVPGMESAEVAAQVRNNFTGSKWDGKIAVGYFSPLGTGEVKLSHAVIGDDSQNNLYKTLFKDDTSHETSPYMYHDKKGEKAKAVLKQVLIETGLLFAPALPEKISGFNQVPTPPYRISIIAEKYFDEGYAGKQSAASRLWQQMTSSTNAYYSEEMLKRGYALIAAQYLFLLKDVESGKTIKAYRAVEQVKARLSKDAAGNVNVAPPYGDEQMLANSLKRFLKTI